jgi:hypothetical protein
MIKKTAILSMTAFYLLLTTGMFVCILHCTAEKLFDKPGMQMQMAGSSTQHQPKHCTHGDDCGCCKSHGAYTIKENLKPGHDLQFSQIAFNTLPVTIPSFLLNHPIYNDNHLWADVKAPPARCGKIISIQHCSLLI